MTSVTNAPQTFRTLKIGAGGWVTGLDQHTDGFLVNRTDTYGAYKWNEPIADQWNQLVTTSSMPAADAVPGNADGVYEICIAPSNSSIIWMCYNERVYKSTDRGVSFTRKANWPSVYMSANGSEQRHYGKKMAVHPTDPTIVFIGTQDNGIYRTLDDGVTWTKRTDVPDPAGSAGDNAPGVTGIAFNPTNSSEIWAFTTGTGYYRSTDGGTSWSKPTGGPTDTVPHAMFSSDGNLYCGEFIGTGGKTWKWNGSSWAELTITWNGGSRTHTVSCDPFAVNRVLFYGEGGGAIETLNAGSTFGTQLNENPLNVGIVRNNSADVLWHDYSKTFANGFMSCGDIFFDKTTQNKVFMSHGIGFSYATIAPGFTTITWYGMSRGIEQLATNAVTACENGDLYVTSWDRPQFKVTDPETFPSSYITLPSGLTHGKAFEYLASNANILAKTVLTANSGYSTDRGVNWTILTPPAEWSFSAGGGGGEIVPLSATQFIWVPTNKLRPHYTTDAGANWSPIALPGVSNDQTADGWAGLNFAAYLVKRVCAPDRVTAGVAYITHQTKGVYKTVDYGATWTQVKNTPITSADGNNTKFRCPPGKAGHIWHTIGDAQDTVAGAFKWSEDGGVTWSTVSGVLEVKDFGFGATKPGASYPRIWIAGYVDDGGGYDFGIYASDDKGATWLRICDGKPLNSLDGIKCLDGDKLNYSKAYGAFDGSGYFYTPGSISGKSFGLQF